MALFKGLFINHSKSFRIITFLETDRIRKSSIEKTSSHGLRGNSYMDAPASRTAFPRIMPWVACSRATQELLPRAWESWTANATGHNFKLSTVVQVTPETELCHF